MWRRLVIRNLKKLCYVHLLTRLKALLMFVVKNLERVKEHNFVKFEDRKGIVNPNFTEKWIPSGIVFRKILRNQVCTFNAFIVLFFLTIPTYYIIVKRIIWKSSVIVHFINYFIFLRRITSYQSPQFNFISVTTSKLFFILCSQFPA